MQSLLHPFQVLHQNTDSEFRNHLVAAVQYHIVQLHEVQAMHCRGFHCISVN